MLLAVLFKAVPDLESIDERDWLPDDGRPAETRFVKTVFNPADESALELALRFKDRAGASGLAAALTALTIGDGRADALLKTLLALRFEAAVRLEPETGPPGPFQPEETARLAADFLREGGYDLALSGGWSADGENGLVPLEAAERLGWPVASGAVDFRPAGGGRVEVESVADGRRTRRLWPTPLMVTLGRTPGAYLRIPTLKDRMSHGRRQPEIRPVAAGPGEPRRRLVSLTRPRAERAGLVIEGADPAQKARRLWELLNREESLS